MLAGMRIDPPPSPACATGTIPLATAAADPPLEPPGVWSRFHGLCVGPYAPRLGARDQAELRRVRLADDHEARRLELREQVARDRSACSRAPSAVGCRRGTARPRACRRDPSRRSAHRGTARREGRSLDAAARARSNSGWITALRSSLNASMRAMAASTSSIGCASPLRTSAAWSVASRFARSVTSSPLVARSVNAIPSHTGLSQPRRSTAQRSITRGVDARTVGEVHRVVVRDRGIDVRGPHEHPVADVHGRARRERHVLVGAEHHRRVGDRSGRRGPCRAPSGRSRQPTTSGSCG